MNTVNSLLLDDFRSLCQESYSFWIAFDEIDDMKAVHPLANIDRTVLVDIRSSVIINSGNCCGLSFDASVT